jgi:hypothetical protein
LAKNIGYKNFKQKQTKKKSKTKRQSVGTSPTRVFQRVAGQPHYYVNKIAALDTWRDIPKLRIMQALLCCIAVVGSSFGWPNGQSWTTGSRKHREG